MHVRSAVRLKTADLLRPAPVEMATRFIDRTIIASTALVLTYLRNVIASSYHILLVGILKY
jgi:hypothetical protein